MAFNSFEFLFVFFPLTLLTYFLLGRAQKLNAQLYWLIACSFGFCGYFDFRYVFALLASIAFNYAIVTLINRTPMQAEKLRSILLNFAVCLNLAALAYFKYMNFFRESINSFAHTNFALTQVWLPLGISFFTFQQIAYLVSSSYGDTKSHGLARYILHVSFFPKLISGPITEYDEWMPQFDDPSNRVFNLKNFVLGLTVFTVGLVKKNCIADPISVWVNTMFSFAETGAKPYFLEAWLAALGYLTQLYYDFSGYSDMAIGIALMLNILLPLNFFSPYKSRSIVEYWQNWHMSLSNFFRGYLFTPMAKFRPGLRHWQLTSLFVTMTICGVWHGAGWTFLVFGVLHGTYVVVNHLWRQNARKAPAFIKQSVNFFSWPLTLAAVTFALVFFRASTLSSAMSLVEAMIGRYGLSLPKELSRFVGFLTTFGIRFKGVFHAENMLITGEILRSLVPPLVATLILPNLYEFTGLRSSAKSNAKGRVWWQWAPSPAWALVFALLTSLGFVSMFSENKQFLYFQF